MRVYYGIATVLLGIIAIYLSVCHLRFKPSPPDKALTKTPKESEFRLEAPKAEDRGAKLPDIKIVWEKDVFSQFRGVAERMDTGLAAAKQVDLELIGICKFGETSGAVIGSKSAGGQLATPGPNIPGIPGAPTAQPAPKSGRKFYAIGQRVGNGFVLKEVLADRVVLARGSEELVLKIQFESDSSNGRRLASVSFKQEAKPAVQGDEQKPQAPVAGETEPPADNSTAKAKGLPKPPPPPAMAPRGDIMT